MKRLLCIAVLALATGPVAAQVGVSVNINEPGLFGRIDLGGFPRPQVLYAQPTYVERPRTAVAPVYLRVRPGQEKNWRQHCGEYNACGQPVYFVQDNWYRNVYQPRYQQIQQRNHGDGRRNDRGPRDNDWRDDDRRGDRGRGGDRGHGGDRDRGGNDRGR